jgi:DNA-binding transcriptional regulator of glucitol operon
MSDGKQKALKVFISSTYIDLKDYRQAAITVVNRYKCVPLAMEFFMSQPAEPTEVCEKEVRECDILVGIYAHRYGFIPEGKNTSITHEEYELAKKEGKECLCFLVDQDFPWKPTLCEFDKINRIKKFMEEIKKEKVLSFFTTPSDFEAKLSGSLGKLLIEKEGTAEQKEQLASGGKLIPVAPTPYIAHSYALPPNFTGREAERAMLCNWLHNAKEPLLVLEAIGGMGKTALSWVWLHEEVLERRAELDGVFWWSFYEDPFETFLEHLYHYVTSKAVKVERGVLESGAVAILNSILHNNRFMLILDGFERALRGYASMRAMYTQEKGLSRQKAGEDDWDEHQRECVHPHAGRFLKALVSAKTRTLMTTRLFPAALEEISGVKHEFLSGLSRSDAVRFLKSEGIEGTRAQMERAGEIYDFHPLMLKQLSSAIRKKRKKDIADAFKLNLIDEKEPHKILNKSFELLDASEKKVATAASVFRSSFDFNTARALFPEMDENTLWEVLLGLQQLGFVFYDEREKRFDFHPIMRSFLYDNLTTKDKVHERAAAYFRKMPPIEKVVSLKDLNPVIELYHHLVNAGKFDEAEKLFEDRIHAQVYYQLSAYNLYIQLLRELFVDGEEKPPRLKSEADRAWTLNSLANSYSLSGEPAKAVPFFLLSTGTYESQNQITSVATDLGNTAQFQSVLGQVSAAAVHSKKEVAICREIKDEFWEAVGHKELSRVLAYQGRAEARDELVSAFGLFEKKRAVQWFSVVSVWRSLRALLQGRLAAAAGGRQKACELSLEALQEAEKALEFEEKTAKKQYPVPRDFVQSYRLLGEALVQGMRVNAGIKKEFEIRFYDEYFQELKEKFIVKAGNELEAAERCLNEALRRCRAVNLVEMEADILLSCARLEWVKTPASGRDAGNIGQIEETLKEAHDIAERAGYRLQLADIHLFCGEVLIETAQGRVLGHSAKEHIEKAKVYAKDVSTFDDLYKSRDPHFYDGIEGYDMLKRGMTEKERIENGYFVAYQIAEVLEKKLKGNLL